MIEIRQGDALEQLLELQPGTFDVVLMDPPYCSGSINESQRTSAKCQGSKKNRFRWFRGDNMGTAGLAFLLRHVALCSAELLKPTGHLLCFTDWRQLPNLIPALESAGLRYQNLVVWAKPSPGMGQGFRAQHEVVVHLTNGSPEYFSASFGNVLTVKRTKNKHHPTQKPVELLDRLLQVTCPPGGRVLDPFAGSGSTAIACQKRGLAFVGVERDGAIVEVAERRVQSQGELFA